MTTDSVTSFHPRVSPSISEVLGDGRALWGGGHMPIEKLTKIRRCTTTKVPNTKACAATTMRAAATISIATSYCVLLLHQNAAVRCSAQLTKSLLIPVPRITAYDAACSVLRSGDRYLRPRPAAKQLHVAAAYWLAIDGTDRQTPYRYIDVHRGLHQKLCDR